MRLRDAALAAWVAGVTCSAYAAVLLRRVVLRRPHPLAWPVDLEMVAAGFVASLRHGNLATMRLLLGAFSRPLWWHPGLRIMPADVPAGCEPAFWVDATPPPAASRAPDVVLAYVHGGAFVAGDPFMCSLTFTRWMRSLREKHGLHARTLCVCYPLAPERPFPAAVSSTAAVFAWALQGCAACDGRRARVVVVGDSAGGNIAVAALAALRDVGARTQQAATAGTAASSGDSACPVTSALERRLFADLAARLAAQQVPAGTEAAAAAAAKAACTQLPVRMPDAVVLVSPATDISPSAAFRGGPAAAAAPAAAAGSCTSDPGTTSDTAPAAAEQQQHHDYLPRGIEARGMGSYSGHHEALAGSYASPVHLPSLAGLTSGGRWLVLSGGVELLAADIHRFVAKLQGELGPAAVVHHEQPALPHSWAIIPCPSLEQLQQVVPEFIAAEHAAATQRGTDA